MKKILACLTAGIMFVVSCTSVSDAEFDEIVEENPAYAQTVPVYSENIVAAPSAQVDWDRAIRVDVDMQNMYANSPRTIKKPIDMYMAMALALKYNYTRRLVSYEQSLIEAGRSPVNEIPEIMGQAGYLNTNNYSGVNSELKIAWNLLDMSTVYYQTVDQQYQANLAYEQSRKVIHNLLQETRVLYWKALTAQRLLPVIDDMNEYLVAEVDELNSRSNELSVQGQSLPMDDLVKKRNYMEAVKKLAELKRDLETSESRLASLMGFHPMTEYKLVGKEYGNFALPELKQNLSEMEWIALTNRPELRMRDYVTTSAEVEMIVREFGPQQQYAKDPNYYNRKWSKKAREIGYQVFEDIKNPRESELESLRRQRMTTLVLSQVYIGWAGYMSAMEDYQINMEIANVSEDIAEDTTIKDGSKAEKSKLESARAIADEVKASLAYIELQDSLGNLYAALGMDALPYYMLGEKPSKIAVYLRNTLEKWRKGEFIPDNRPYLLDVPSRRPPVNLSDSAAIPDQMAETGQKIQVTIPKTVLDKMNFSGKVTFRAGLNDDSPLPSWLRFDELTRTISGTPMPGDVGEYVVKIYMTDENGKVAYVTFKIKIVEVYVPSIRVMGLTPGRRATVLKRCIGPQCTDEYIENDVVGEEIVAKPQTPEI